MTPSRSLPCMNAAYTRRFKDMTEALGLDTSEAWTTGASFADLNNDGHLDLYVCVYGKDAVSDDTSAVSIAGATGSFVYHDANDGGSNQERDEQLREQPARNRM